MVELLTALGGTGADVSGTFYAALMTLIGAIVAGFPLEALLRANGEESSGRLEHVLVTAVGRTRWIAGHITCAVAGTLTLLLLLGGIAGLSEGVVTGDPAARLITLGGAVLVQAPATLALAGAAIAAIGCLPRIAGALVWAGLTAAILLGPIGGIFDLAGVVRDLSPFTHVPPAPAADIPATPLLALIAIAALLATAGLLRFARRDLTLPASTRAIAPPASDAAGDRDGTGVAAEVGHGLANWSVAAVKVGSVRSPVVMPRRRMRAGGRRCA